MASHSTQACLACKRHKRRCDKLLPDCSLCRRTSRPCVYGADPDPLPTASEWASLQARLAALENRLADTPAVSDFSNTASVATSGTSLAASSTTFGEANFGIGEPGSSRATSNHGLAGFTPAYSNTEDESPDHSSRFPASIFLDIDCYIWSHVRLPAHHGTIPAPILALLSQDNAILDVSQKYFATIHTWLPIVSKKRMDMGLPVQNAGPDLAMLFIAMKLVTSTATDDLEFALYRTVKDFLDGLVSDGTISLLVLQAMVLIALYEYGHAIYPAAWMTVGSCARYSDILGLASGDHALLGQPTTWTEAEERRRTWWSVFILDKVMVIGSRRRCVWPELPTKGRLPANDEAWDSGEVSKAVGYPTSTPYQTEQSAFARLCQASIYLCQVITHSRAESMTGEPQIEKTVTLVHELTGYVAALDSQSADWTLEQSLPLLVSKSIARSALFVVLDRFTCPEKIGAQPGYVAQPGAKSQEELDIQTQSMEILEGVSEKLHAMAMAVLRVIRGSEDRPHSDTLSRLSPFIMDSIYAGAATFHWLGAENGKDAYFRAAAEMDMFLDALSLRWRLGSAFREIVKMHDVSTRVAATTASR